MYSLNTLQKLNAERCKAPARESETTRHCSYCVSIGRSGKKPIKQVVLHSAKHRNTALISWRRSHAVPHRGAEHQQRRQEGQGD